MTGIKDNNVPAFAKVAKEVRARGYRIINPAELDKGEPKRSWEECLRRDIREMMLHCDGVATLPGWKKSRGATLEVMIAKALGWPVKSHKLWR